MTEIRKYKFLTFIILFIFLILINFSSALSYGKGVYGSGIYGIGSINQIGSSTTSQSFPIFTPNKDQIEEGYIKTLYKSWEIGFEFDNENHIIKLNDIINKTAIITVSSKLQTFNLSLNETKKLNLDGDEFFDLEIFLQNITNYKADLIIKFIREEIPIEFIEEKKEIKKKYDERLFLWLIFSLIIILIITILIIIIIKRRKLAKRRGRR